MVDLYVCVSVVVLFCEHKDECAMINTEDSECSYKPSILLLL